MTLDENAAAFGLFHLAFANLHQQLATVVFLLRRAQEPHLKFDEIFKLKFSRLQSALKEELRKLDRNSSMAVEIQLLRKACSDLGPLADWRNERVHARVRISENGIESFNWRTRTPLSVHRDEGID